MCTDLPGTSSNIIALIYRTGSISSTFFSELTDLFEHLFVHTELVVVAGDLNIEQLNDRATTQLNGLLSTFGLLNHMHVPTHNLGGTLDVLITRKDHIICDVNALNVDLSDYLLIYWKSKLARVPPVYRSDQIVQSVYTVDLFTQRKQQS